MWSTFTEILINPIICCACSSYWTYVHTIILFRMSSLYLKSVILEVTQKVNYHLLNPVRSRYKTNGIGSKDSETLEFILHQPFLSARFLIELRAQHNCKRAFYCLLQSTRWGIPYHVEKSLYKFSVSLETMFLVTVYCYHMLWVYTPLLNILSFIQKDLGSLQCPRPCMCTVVTPW